MTRPRGFIILAIIILALAWTHPAVRSVAHPIITRIGGRATLLERLQQLGAPPRSRLNHHFSMAGVDYPPDSVIMVGLKAERQLEIHATSTGVTAHITSYPILAASGTAGPKLRRGDRQVPEGFYRIDSLNPNSRFHLSMRLNYPNREDGENAAQDGRTDLGGDIFIHGGASSIGCLAIGDEAIEEVFVLAADVGIDQVQVLLAPCDLRHQAAPRDERGWVEALYGRLGEMMRACCD